MQTAIVYFYDIQELEYDFFSKHYEEGQAVFNNQSLTKENSISDAEIVSVFVSSLVTKEVLDLMPKLKCIVTRSTGFDHIDMREANARGIVVCSVPSYGEHTVAEYAFGLLLSLTRKIPEIVSMTKNNLCIPPERVRGVDLSGKTLGVLGAGRIGKKMIAMGKGFGMNVIAYDPYEDKEAALALQYSYASLESVLKESDVISLHLPSTEETYHILNREKLALLKRGAYLVNTARGELVDTQALIESIGSGILAGAALDVCEGEELLRKKCSEAMMASLKSEKLLKESAELQMLKSFPQVLLSPHVAYDTEEAIIRICTTAQDSITGFIEGRTINQVHYEGSFYGKLIIARHTESVWNKEGKWTGSRDVHLSDKGFEDARLLGETIKEIHVDHAFASEQVRTMETLSSMLGTMRQPTVPITRSASLNERDYGEYTGKNKHVMKELLGEEMFERVRRGYDVPVPNGETLKDVVNRVVPYYTQVILPKLQQGQNVLIVSHGNALRALLKHIEMLSDEAIEQTEMMFGGVVIFSFNGDGTVHRKEVRETPSRSFDYV